MKRMQFAGVGLLLMCGCDARLSSEGGQHGQPNRQIKPEDIAVPDGYSVELVTKGLTFATAVAFDESGPAPWPREKRTRKSDRKGLRPLRGGIY